MLYFSTQGNMNHKSLFFSASSCELNAEIKRKSIFSMKFMPFCAFVSYSTMLLFSASPSTTHALMHEGEENKKK